MPVVINEFEIDIEQPETPRPEPTETEQPPTTAHLHPEDIMRIYRRCRTRLKRVWAN